MLAIKMLIRITRSLSSQLGIRCMCSVVTPKGPPQSSGTDFDATDIFNENQAKRKLKVAILGAPNVGKSTLINKIIGHPVLCVSTRAHTTRQRERAAVVKDNTQIVFVDTPGLVSRAKLKRHKLDESFRKDGLSAVHESNIVGVIHDVADPYNKDRLDPNIMHILQNMGRKRAFLVLNKVDIIESKKQLLALIKRLTMEPVAGDQLEEPLSDSLDQKGRKKFVQPYYWTEFLEVFLVSALKGDGVGDILEYLVKESKSGPWTLPEGKITDRPWHEVLQELVRGRLLDSLPHEIPYALTIETEYFHENELGEVVAVVLVTCPVERYSRMLLAQGGRKVSQVAKLAEADARAALRTHVRLRIVVNAKEKVLLQH